MSNSDTFRRPDGNIASIPKVETTMATTKPDDQSLDWSPAPRWSRISARAACPVATCRSAPGSDVIGAGPEACQQDFGYFLASFRELSMHWRKPAQSGLSKPMAAAVFPLG